MIDHGTVSLFGSNETAVLVGLAYILQLQRWKIFRYNPKQDTGVVHHGSDEENPGH